MTTPEEKEVLGHLAQAWSRFIAMGNKHPSDVAEFSTALHVQQMIIAWRVARRADPETWGANS
jgi:hypothetical protein